MDFSAQTFPCSAYTLPFRQLVDYCRVHDYSPLMHFGSCQGCLLYFWKVLEYGSVYMIE